MQNSRAANRTTRPFLYISRYFIILIVAASVSSCTVQKRYSMAGYSVEWFSGSKKVSKRSQNANKQNTTCSHGQPGKQPSATRPLNAASGNPKENLILSANASEDFSASLIQKTRPAKTDIVRVDHLPCDTLVDKHDSKTAAHVLEVTPTEIRYKKCDNPDGPVFTVSKSDFRRIVYANGTTDILAGAADSPVYYPPRPATPELNVMAFMSFMFGAGSFLVFILAPIGAILAIIFGAIGLTQIKRTPAKYYGAGFAIAGIICGTVILLITALIIALVTEVFEGTVW